MEITAYLRFALALGFVLALIAVIAWLARRYGLGQGGWARSMAGRGRRLRIVETLSLDPRHRLVLIQRDDRQHLLLIGAGGQLVVEQNLTPTGTTDRPEGNS